MRIAELSRCTGVPIPTIKYYLRERLVPPGERTSANQAQYEEIHIHRLKLVRALVDVGGLSIAATRHVLDLMNSPGTTTLDALGKAQYELTARREHVEDEAWQAAHQRLDKLLTTHNWQVRPKNPARQMLAEVLATLHRLGQDADLGLLEDYAAAADQVATAEVETVRRRSDVDSMAEGVVIWTVLGDALFAGLRRIAQEAISARQFAEAGNHRSTTEQAGSDSR